METIRIQTFDKLVIHVVNKKKMVNSVNEISITGFTINPFLANAPILYPQKTREIFGFLVFSGGIKWEFLPEMVH